MARLGSGLAALRWWVVFSFWPIFNLADAAIFGGVVVLLVFQYRFLPDMDEKKAEVPVLLQQQSPSPAEPAKDRIAE